MVHVLKQNVQNKEWTTDQIVEVARKIVDVEDVFALFLIFITLSVFGLQNGDAGRVGRRYRAGSGDRAISFLLSSYRKLPGVHVFVHVMLD